MSYTTLGVTGQRPKSLGLGAFEPKEPTWVDAYEFVRRRIAQLGAEVLVSGGALGFDMVAAKAAIDAGIGSVLALPFEGFDAWNAKDKRRLEWLMERSVFFYVCDPGYAPWKYQKRNEAIVERADYMLAFWNNEPGGTANCLRSAIEAGVGYEVKVPRL